MNIMKQQIIKLFTNPTKAMKEGLWFSGYKGEGIYKEWWPNGVIFKVSFYKDGERHGEDRIWNENNILVMHRWFKNGELDGEYKSWNRVGKLGEHSWYEQSEEVADFIQHPELKKKYNIK